MKTECFGITNRENMIYQRTQYRGKVKRHEAKFQEGQYLNHRTYNINNNNRWRRNNKGRMNKENLLNQRNNCCSV